MLFPKAARASGFPPTPAWARRIALPLGFVLFGAAVYLALGMGRGLLLSSDIKSKCWPWAPSVAASELQAPGLSDPVWQFVPWIELARREIGEGRIPLWNPYQDGGVPLLGNSQSALGSPLLWPALALGIARGWNLSLLLRILTAAACATLWLRDRGRSRLPAALGGLAFALSGAFVAWLEHPHTLTAAAVPLVLLFASRLAGAPLASSKDRAGLAIATAIVLLGGHPETSLMAAALAVGVSLAIGGLLGLLRTLLPALAGAALAGPFLLPFAEYFWLSAAHAGFDRHPFVLPFAGLARFVLPGSGAGGLEAASTISLAALALLPFGLSRLRGDREATFYAASAAAALLAAYRGPVADALAAATPIYWTRVVLLLPLPLGFLASAGLELLLVRAESRGAGRIAQGTAALLVAAAAAELLIAARGVHAVTPARLVDLETPLLARLAADHGRFHVLPLHTFLPPNAATTYGLHDLRGYDALTPLAWRRERQSIGRFRSLPTITDGIEPWDLAAGGRALDSWSVKYLLLHPQFRFGAETLDARLGLDLREVYSGPDGRILENRRALPLIRFEPRGTVTVYAETTLRLAVDVEASGAGELVVARPFFPGWVTFADGAKVRWSETPGRPFRIPIRAGRHHVEIRYRPRSFLAGCVLGALGALAAAFWVSRSDGS